MSFKTERRLIEGVNSSNQKGLIFVLVQMRRIVNESFTEISSRKDIHNGTGTGKAICATGTQTGNAAFDEFMNKHSDAGPFQIAQA
jgi:hypothetical protein